jgi:phospholipase A1
MRSPAHFIYQASLALFCSMLLVCSNSAAGVDDCKLIVDDLERLGCYDEIIQREATSDEALLHRNKLAEAAQENPFALAPYRPNYLIPLSYNDKPNRDPFEQFIEPGGTMDNIEVKFQFSFQLDISRDIYHSGIDLYFAYTQLAFWQAYNSSVSKPFRETNYEPELGIKINPDYELFGLRNFEARLGIVHQSNGRNDPISRSWNRVVGTLMFGRGNYVAVLRPWLRIPESDEDDNNPDIEDYLGNFEIYNIYKNGESTYAVMLRNNLQTSDNRGAIQIDMSIALDKRFKLYLQYFNGYGESLIDYNHISNRFGIGIMLTDWL